ncbi:hypothetical protein, partial [Sulfitobacter pacificus]|uniref:hypothetical protein n=1 Tax=Sulfitobacter pacificus TaxID=1499314 RepID=UPI0024E0AC4D
MKQSKFPIKSAPCSQIIAQITAQMKLSCPDQTATKQHTPQHLGLSTDLPTRHIKTHTIPPHNLKQIHTIQKLNA